MKLIRWILFTSILHWQRSSGFSLQMERRSCQLVTAVVCLRLTQHLSQTQEVSWKTMLARRCISCWVMWMVQPWLLIHLAQWSRRVLMEWSSKHQRRSPMGCSVHQLNCWQERQRLILWLSLTPTKTMGTRTSSVEFHFMEPHLSEQTLNSMLY